MTYYTAGVDEIHMLAREHALAETGLVNGESMSEPFASLIDMSGYQPEAGIADGEGGLEAPPGGLAQRPPRLLLTLLGDYWWQQTEPLPSAALVALLAEFGVSDSAARAALSRLTRNRLLVTSKSGRRTFVRLSGRAARILDEGARRIFSFGGTTWPWDGEWSLVAFSIPEHNRSARDALRKQLRWLGFAPLYDGVWVSPRDHATEVVQRRARAVHHHLRPARPLGRAPGPPDRREVRARARHRGGLPQLRRADRA